MASMFETELVPNTNVLAQAAVNANDAVAAIIDKAGLRDSKPVPTNVIISVPENWTKQSVAPDSSTTVVVIDKAFPANPTDGMYVKYGKTYYKYTAPASLSNDDTE